MTLKEAMHLLDTDPRTLLDSAYVRIAGGSSTSVSGVMTFAIEMPEADQNVWSRNGARVPTVSIRTWTQMGPKPGDTWKAGTSTYMAVRAFYIAMKQAVNDDASAPTGTRHTLPCEGGPYNVCITSQLTGCTFGIGSQAPGGSCLVTHIQPKASASMAAQTTNLLGAAPDFLVQKGGAGGYTESAAVLGHRAHGRWAFFIQEQNRLQRVIEPVRELH